jgi:hypothetical protein
MKGVTYKRSVNEMLCRLNYLWKPELYLYFDEACKLMSTRNNIVDIVTRLRTGQRRNHVRFQGGARDFLFSTKHPLVPGPI